MVVFGKGWPFIYPSLWDGVAINLTISLGEGGDLFIHLLGKGMPPIYPSIYEGMAINLPIYLGGDSPLSTYLFVKGCPIIWEGIVIDRSIYLLFIYFWKGWSFIYPSFWEGIAIHLAIYFGEGGNLNAHLLGKGCHLFTHHL